MPRKKCAVPSRSGNYGRESGGPPGTEEKATMQPVLRYLFRELAGEPCALLSDGQLLELYCTRQDGRAFAALVARHGPLVLGVCHRALSHAQDAEDAFQATFLVLAQRAASIRQGSSLGSWLHGVAARLARQARRTAARRRRYEREAPSTDSL